MITTGRKGLNDPQGNSATKPLTISADSNLPNILRRVQTVGQANPTVAGWVISVCAWPKGSISLGEMWIETGGPSSSRTADGEELRGAGGAVISTSRKSRGVFISGFHLHPKSGAFGRLALIHFSVFNRLTSTPSRHTSSENSWCPQKSRIASSVLASSSFGGSVRKLAMISASRSWLKISSC